MKYCHTTMMVIDGDNFSKKKEGNQRLKSADCGQAQFEIRRESTMEERADPFALAIKDGRHER